MRISEFKKKFSVTIHMIILLFIGISGLGLTLPIIVFAEEDNTISGDVYVFENEKSAYNFSACEANKTAKANGSLQISGDIDSISTEDGIQKFAVKGNYDELEDMSLSISYMYDDLLKAEEEEWHLVDDSSKKVDTISLEEKIKKGVLILQTSRDGEIWVTAYTETNIFENKPDGMPAFYNITDVQIVNGCYYRVIIAYEMSRKLDPKKVLFVSLDNYECQKYAEVYTFYVYDKKAQDILVNDNTRKYNLGSKVRTKKYAGYYGEADITKKDPHYGWDLGEFFVSGYTDSIEESNGNRVFLKNVGDKVTLWFNLQQDINCLDGKAAITIMEDTAGYDQYFETSTLNFGHGALIIQKTNYENVTEEPVIYTNYLEAVATMGANTKVNLFEEGDYEVALDYAINYDKTKIFGQSVLPEQAHYRIFFRFSIRNSNSMVFLREIDTGSELADRAITKKGFYLDLANSKYLQLNIVKEVLNGNAKGLNKDVRFNTAAKDGNEYKEEGIYQITVTNPYTNESTVKKVCVGENNLLKAHITTDLPIGEIQDKIAQGATISEDGVIIEQSVSISEEQEITEKDMEETVVPAIEETIENNEERIEGGEIEQTTKAVSGDSVIKKDKNNIVTLIAVCAIVIITIAYVAFVKKHDKNEEYESEKGDNMR